MEKKERPERQFYSTLVLFTSSRCITFKFKWSESSYAFRCLKRNCCVIFCQIAAAAWLLRWTEERERENFHRQHYTNAWNAIATIRWHRRFRIHSDIWHSAKRNIPIEMPRDNVYKTSRKNVNNCFNFILPFDPSSAVSASFLFRRADSAVSLFCSSFQRLNWIRFSFFFYLCLGFVVISCKYGNFQFMSIAVLFIESLYLLWIASDAHSSSSRQKLEKKEQNRWKMWSERKIIENTNTKGK